MLALLPSLLVNPYGRVIVLSATLTAEAGANTCLAMSAFAVLVELDVAVRTRSLPPGASVTVPRTALMVSLTATLTATEPATATLVASPTPEVATAE